MILIVCVDDNMGMAFNKRRQSRDKALTERILRHASGGRLLVNQYSAGLFQTNQVQVEDSFMEKAAPGEYCFAENTDVLPFEDKIEKLILFRWNRRYPADLYFNIPLKDHGFKLIHTEEFSGSSHKTITEEIYLQEELYSHEKKKKL